MPYYNMTSLGSNSSGILGFVQGVNSELVGGYLGIMILIMLSVLMFMAFMGRTGDVKKSIIGTSFLAFGISLFMAALSLIPNLAIFICLIMAGLSVAFIGRDGYS